MSSPRYTCIDLIYAIYIILKPFNIFLTKTQGKRKNVGKSCIAWIPDSRQDSGFFLSGTWFTGKRRLAKKNKPEDKRANRKRRSILSE